MSILKPKPTIERTQFRVSIDKQILSDVERYCEYANFKKVDDFLEEAALHILSKDKDFREWKDKAIEEHDHS